MNYQEFCDSVLPYLKEKFVLHLDKKSSNDDKIALRSSISSGTEAEIFLQEFSSITNTKWIVLRKKTHFTRIVYRKDWICQLSSHRKKNSSSSRDLKCGARMTISVKKLTKCTKAKDPHLAASVPLCGIINIDLTHSHPVISADTLKKLRVSDEVQKQFFSYFDDGLGAMTAKRCHENMLLMSENFLIDLANAAKNPTERQVYYLYKKWQGINVGPVGNPFEKLLQKMSLYEEKGATVKLDYDGTWAVLIVTGLMKRVHSLLSSSEIVFLDTTASCEGTNSSLTIMLAATKAGAIPIAAFIHENQTADSYVKAFSMLKKHFPLCFGGKKLPAVFMTDDSKAEKNALSVLWKDSVQLLCHFHVAQAEWRWLHCSKDIPQHIKPIIMRHFQSIMYATSEDDLLEQYNKLLTFAAKYPSYINRLKKFFERRAEWTLCDRQQYIIRGHNTNNFAEASIRIIKDIVLCRTKAFNVVALSDFIVNVWENFLSLKLLEFANGRRNSVLWSRLNKTYDVPFDECIQISNQLFSLPSLSNKNIMYEVNVDVGYCTCQRGRTGAFCKHQCFLFRKLKIEFPNAPVLSSNDRLQLAFIATGKKNLNEQFYQNIEEDIALPMIGLDQPSMTCGDNVKTNLSDVATLDEKEDLLKEVKRLLMSEHSKASINRLTAVLKNKKNPEEIKSCITTMALAVSSRSYKNSKEKKIKVQPTSISRRLPRGSQKFFSKKRQHDLKKNITNNVPNAK